jgi:hypothetical protein
MESFIFENLNIFGKYLRDKCNYKPELRHHDVYRNFCLLSLQKRHEYPLEVNYLKNL